MSALNRRQQQLARHPEHILTLAEFARLNSICRATLLRLIARGEGPKLIRLSPRRIGVRASDAAAWQAERIQKGA